MTFAARFAANLTPGPPVSLQAVFPTSLPDAGLTAAELAAAVRAFHPDLADAVVELVTVVESPAVAELVSPAGPPLAWAAVVSWGRHVVKLAAFDAPMPYGPVASCVVPALMPPEVKRDAAAHRSHVLFYHSGTEPDPVERYVALGCVGGVLGQFGATAILNEDGRTACPAFDLIPGPGEDVLATLRELPLTYLWVGFVRTSVGGPARPWIRTYNAHRFGLPDLAYQAAGLGEAGEVFGWFAAVLGYLHETNATIAAGQVVNFDAATELLVDAPPSPGGDLFDSDGELLVLRRAAA